MWCQRKKKKKLLLETGEPHHMQSRVSESITCKYCSKAMANSVFLFWKQIFSDSWCFLIVRVITFPLPAVVTTEKNGPSNPSQSIRTYHAFIYSLLNLLKCVIINYIYLCRNMKTRKKNNLKVTPLCLFCSFYSIRRIFLALRVGHTAVERMERFLNSCWIDDEI